MRLLGSKIIRGNPHTKALPISSFDLFLCYGRCKNKLLSFVGSVRMSLVLLGMIMKCFVQAFLGTSSSVRRFNSGG